ncbi:hypothetical protein DIPPA_22638 [Diplonema papillatum]|nr:hypothetical protein DIPPA_22638 [Diplonema papillatum]
MHVHVQSDRDVTFWSGSRQVWPWQVAPVAVPAHVGQLPVHSSIRQLSTGEVLFDVPLAGNGHTHVQSWKVR